MSKYKKVPSCVGIRKNLSSGTYEASKKIKGKTYSATFNSLNEAKLWRNTFNPFSNMGIPKQTSGCTFGELWERYEEDHFPNLERTTQDTKRRKINVFFNELAEMKLEEINSQFISRLLKVKKKEAIDDPFSKRMNFNKALDEIRAILNWYREEEEDHNFRIPVLRKHYRNGVITKSKPKEKAMSQDEFIRLIDSFDTQLFKDFALIQFFCAGRYGEIAGIQLKNIDLENKTLLIKETVIVDQKKRFLELKQYPKNGETRVVPISDKLFLEAITRRVQEAKKGCSFLFHVDGNPIGYRKVQYRYDRALRAAGLHPKFSGTHILRHTMATESRRVVGTLDAAQAVTGHKSRKMVEHYAKIPTTLQMQAITEVGMGLQKRMNELK